ncbi:P-loop containing nucleoside triphosphate hydrolase protein [Chiua virens]|nr:P-loop containing nucleoside triphosphate hydrolase protein [Chiua virens]
MNKFTFGSRLKNTRKRASSHSSSTSTGMQTPPDDIWGDLDLSSTEYARKRRELMQLINDLRSLGADTMISLPSIVVIGSQSAGKSSLVEAVSGVNVPRDSGTCTRCPMECTMSSNATTWSCNIKLRFDHDLSGRSSSSTPRETAFGPAITDKNLVDVWLRRAQTAILNPDQVPETFHKMSIQELKDFAAASTNSLPFSRNVVSLFIEDPSATDLSFVDLPGLIQNDAQHVVNLVRELTEYYINKENTIILTTIPMSDDIQNQQSVTLARTADPEGERTIGVLTKPDMLGDGAVGSKKNWLDVIEGRQHPLKHGYYCVRLPDDAQRAQRLSRGELQRIAEEYFDTTLPWKDVAERRRFGISGFVSDISALLVCHIKKVIPKLKEDIEQLLSTCLEDIGTLPERLNVDPQIEVLVRVNKFCDAFKGAVTGASSDKTLAQHNRALYAIFAHDIRATSPDFRPFEDPEQHCSIDALDSEEHATTRNDQVQTMGLYDVRETIEESISWELPGNIPYEAKTRLICQFTTLWSSPAESCLTSINDVLDDIIQQLVKTHFGRFKVLHNLVSDLIRPDIEEYKTKALAAIKTTLGIETFPIYTQNLQDYQSLRERWLAKYRKARQTLEDGRILQPTGAYSGPHSNHANGHGRAIDIPPEVHALAYLAQAGYGKLTVDDLPRLLPPDERFEDELIVMADVRAYFTIACKRVIDTVPLKIEQSLHQALAEKLSVSLLQLLIADTTSTGNSADRMNELVSEDPAVEAKRSRLEALKTRLQEMRRKLVNFAN